MPSDEGRHRCAVSGKMLAGEDSISLGRRLKVRSNVGFAIVDPSTMTGVGRRVSIRITVATLLTRYGPPGLVADWRPRYAISEASVVDLEGALTRRQSRRSNPERRYFALQFSVSR